MQLGQSTDEKNKNNNHVSSFESGPREMGRAGGGGPKIVTHCQSRRREGYHQEEDPGRTGDKAGVVGVVGVVVVDDAAAVAAAAG